LRIVQELEREAERLKKVAEQEAKIRQQFRDDLERKEKDRQNFGSGVNPFFHQQFQVKGPIPASLEDTDVYVEVRGCMTTFAPLIHILSRQYVFLQCNT
jgi:hypothetical protein